MLVLPQPGGSSGPVVDRRPPPFLASNMIRRVIPLTVVAVVVLMMPNHGYWPQARDASYRVPPAWAPEVSGQ